MPQNQIIFIDFNRRITDDIVDVFLETSYLMIRESRKRKHIKSRFCEGEMKTSLALTSFNGMGRLIEFTTQVEASEGKYTAHFLMDTAGLSDWETRDLRLMMEDTHPLRAPRPNPIKRVARMHVQN